MNQIGRGAIAVAVGLTAACTTWLGLDAFRSEAAADLRAQERGRVRAAAQRAASELDRRLAGLVHAAESTAAYIAVRPDAGNGELAQYVSQLEVHHRDILFIGLYREDRLTFAHPLASARDLLGISIQEMPTAEECRDDARANARAVLGGPFRSPAGERLLAVRAPVFSAVEEHPTERSYLGLVTVTFRAESVEEWVQRAAQESEVRLHVITTGEGRGHTRGGAWGDATVVAATPERDVLEVLGERWAVAAVPERGWAPPLPERHRALDLGLTVVAGALAFGATTSLVRGRRRRRADKGEDARRPAGSGLEATLREAEAMIDRLPVGVGVSGADGRVIRMNAAGAALHGYDDPAELVGRHAEDLVDREYHEQMRQDFAALRDGATVALDGAIVRKDGTRCLAELRAVPLLDEGGAYAGCLFTIVDASEHHERREKEEAARLAAEEVARVKDQLLTNVSHELRTPMNAILGMAYLALRTELSSQQRDYVDKIRIAAQLLLGLLGDLLDLAKMDAGKLALESIEFELDEVLERIDVLSGDMAAEKATELWFERDAAVPPVLVGDPLRLGQVLVNLVSNAIKFTDGGEVGVRVELVGRREGLLVVKFSVTDTGVGIPEEQRGIIFDAFRQGDASISRRVGGFGLGLSISKLLVEAMGGEIGVTSQVGVGSTFWFTAMLQPSSLSEEVRRAGTRDEFAGQRILVVDDTESVRRALGNMLGTMGFDVASAAGGEEGLALLHVAMRLGRPFSAVLVDSVMPGMDGSTFLREVRGDARIEPPPSVLMVASRAPERLQAEARSSGGSVILSKPASPSSLFDAMSRALSLQVARAEVGSSAVAARGNELRGLHLLVVEDNPLNQQVARELLEQAGAAVQVADDGTAAVAALDAGDVDLVLMDLQMPGMNGFEATARLRKTAYGATVPVVAMTAHAKREDRDRSLAAGMVDHVTKPIDPRELLAVVRRRARRSVGGLASTPPPSEVGVVARLPSLPPPPRAPVVGALLGIDVKAGADRLGDRALYEKLLRQFAASWSDGAARVRAPLARGDRQAAADVAHALRGVAANLSIHEVEETSAALEELLRDEAGGDPDAAVLRFERALASAVDAIRSGLGEA